MNSEMAKQPSDSASKLQSMIGFYNDMFLNRKNTCFLRKQHINLSNTIVILVYNGIDPALIERQFQSAHFTNSTVHFSIDDVITWETAHCLSEAQKTIRLLEEHIKDSEAKRKL